MKNSRKINGGIFGIIAALALICTQSAFTPGTATRYYFYNDQWQTTPPTTETCQFDEDRMCSGLFETAPESETNLIVDNDEATGIEVGKLQ